MPASESSDYRARLVKPFYLEMMRLNATLPSLQDKGNLLHDVKQAGDTSSPVEVIYLLRDAWRERVMGAWFATMHNDDAVTEQVLTALRTSFGDLDSPPLIVAALTLAGDDAASSLLEYARRDLEHEWGAAGLAAAALNRLASGEKYAKALPPPRASDQSNLSSLLGVIEKLRDS